MGEEAREPTEENQGSQVPEYSETRFKPLQRSSRPTTRMPANVLFHPDGRIQLSTAVVQWLWPTNPAGEEGYPKPQRVRLLARWSNGRARKADHLVIVAAREGEEDSIVANPVGRREIRWPVVYVLRGARFIRQLGIYGHARYLTRDIFLKRPDGTQRRAVLVDLRQPPIEGRVDDVSTCLRRWAMQATPGVPVSRADFLAQIRQIAAQEGVPITRRQLEEYIRTHREVVRKLNLRFTLSGKTTFREVVLEARPSEQPE